MPSRARWSLASLLVIFVAACGGGNTYSDLAEVARYLVAQGYTSASRLGVQGWSNGGTSSAAAVLLYPDLFAVALPRVGVHDLTRYTLFTSGFGWTRDYGDPTVQAEFANLMTFSPLHSVQARSYPAIYVLTGQDDQRVVPGHSKKLAAALQNVATGPGPYLMHSFASSGHGIEGERQRSEAHALTFFFTHTGTAPAPVYRMCEVGELPHFRVRNAIRVPLVGVKAYLGRHRRG